MGLGPMVAAWCPRLCCVPSGQTVTAQDWLCGLTQRHRETRGPFSDTLRTPRSTARSAGEGRGHLCRRTALLGHQGTLGLGRLRGGCASVLWRLPPTPQRAAHRPSHCSPGAGSPVENRSRKCTAGAPQSWRQRHLRGARGSEGPVCPRPAGCPTTASVGPARLLPCRGPGTRTRCGSVSKAWSSEGGCCGGWQWQPGWAVT